MFSQSVTIDSLIKIDTKSFDEFVSQCEQNNLKVAFPLDSLKVVTLAKLRQGQFVTDDAIVTSVQMVYKEDLTSNGYEVSNTIKYIDELIASLFKRKSLRVDLLILRNSYTPKSNGKDGQGLSTEIDSTFDEILIYSENTISKFVNIKLRYLLDMALSKELSSDKKKAEELYVEVQDYPFWTIKDPKLRSRLRGYYIQACKRRIEINRGNIKGLRLIAYVPSVADDVEPTLKIYVEELGVSWKKFIDDED
jgi:hypothetical protein